MAEGGISSKALAMPGVLSAVNAALRPLGAGTAGIETVFFVLVLAGRVYGPGFGLTPGCTSLLRADHGQGRAARRARFQAPVCFTPSGPAASYGK